MQEKLCFKWRITQDELQAGIDELCANGVAKSCFQNTNVLLALMDLLTSGDIEAYAKNDNKKNLEERKEK